MTIQFDDRKPRPLAALDDTLIEEARKMEEKENGPLPTDPRTDFPTFTIFANDGAELGGG